MQNWRKRSEKTEEDKTLTTHIKQFNHGEPDATETLIATANKTLPQSCKF